MKKDTSTKTASITVRIPKELKRQLELQAKRAERPISWIVTKMIMAGLNPNSLARAWIKGDWEIDQTS